MSKKSNQFIELQKCPGGIFNIIDKGTVMAALTFQSSPLAFNFGNYIIENHFNLAK